MKKILLSFLLMSAFSTFSGFTTPAFAGCDYSDKCAPKAYDVSSKCGQVFSKATGATFMTEQVAELIIKNELKKQAKGKFNVDIKTYSANDLIHGRFKSMKISGEDINTEGVYLSSLDLKTLCGFNYVELDKKSIKFKENMVLNFKAQITNDDLQKTIKSSGYLNKINNINLACVGITFLKLNKTKVEIKDSKIYFTVTVTSDFFFNNSIDMVASAKLKVKNGNIVLTKVDFLTFFAKFDLNKITEVLNMINPLNFTVDVLENKNTKISVQEINIAEDRIFIEGNVFIPKNTIQITK